MFPYFVVFLSLYSSRVPSPAPNFLNVCEKRALLSRFLNSFFLVSGAVLYYRTVPPHYAQVQGHAQPKVCHFFRCRPEVPTPPRCEFHATTTQKETTRLGRPLHIDWRRRQETPHPALVFHSRLNITGRDEKTVRATTVEELITALLVLFKHMHTSSGCIIPVS